MTWLLRLTGWAEDKISSPAKNGPYYFMWFGHKDLFAQSYCEVVERAKESGEDECVGVCLCVVPESSYRGETFGCLREVTEQRKLCGVIEVLEVPERRREDSEYVHQFICSLSWNGLFCKLFHLLGGPFNYLSFFNSSNVFKINRD